MFAVGLSDQRLVPENVEPQELASRDAADRNARIVPSATPRALEVDLDAVAEVCVAERQPIRVVLVRKFVAHRQLVNVAAVPDLAGEAGVNTITKYDAVVLVAAQAVAGIHEAGRVAPAIHRVGRRVAAFENQRCAAGRRVDHEQLTLVGVGAPHPDRNRSGLGGHEAAGGNIELESLACAVPLAIQEGNNAGGLVFGGTIYDGAKCKCCHYHAPILVGTPRARNSTHDDSCPVFHAQRVKNRELLKNFGGIYAFTK